MLEEIANVAIRLFSFAPISHHDAERFQLKGDGADLLRS